MSETTDHLKRLSHISFSYLDRIAKVEKSLNKVEGKAIETLQSIPLFRGKKVRSTQG